ncbi:hypothetical protein BD560DRAFT_439548 [Blakeslea trispora]|nr:hypothetical protein BD560DRAFT_439548 [Blakeslea trispora]
MLDHNELSKFFNESQMQDIIDLYESDLHGPTKRIRKKRSREIKPGHIPRPVNSFISFRTEKQAIIRKFCPTANHRDISRITAKWWRTADPMDKDIFVKKAATAKAEHSKKYPDYVFSPKLKNPKKTRKPYLRRPKDSLLTDKDTLSNSVPPKLVETCNDSTPFSKDHAVYEDSQIYNDHLVYSEASQNWSYDTYEHALAFPNTTMHHGITDAALNYNYMPYEGYLSQLDLSYQLYSRSFDDLTSNLNLYNYEFDLSGNNLIHHELESTPYSQLLSTPSLEHAKSPISSCQQNRFINDPHSTLSSFDTAPFKALEDNMQDINNDFNDQLIKPFDTKSMPSQFRCILDDPTRSSSFH